jgi:hypothetical protein
VAVVVGVSVAEAAGETVGPRVGEGTSVWVAAGVAVLVGVRWSVGIALGVAVDVIVGLGVHVLVKATSRQTGQESVLPRGSRVWSYSSYIFTFVTPGNCFSVSIRGWAMLYEVPFGAQLPSK